MRVMIGMVLTEMLGIHRWSSFIMGVGHITIPSLFKIHKLVPPPGPNKLQRPTSSRVEHNKKTFTQGYLGDVPTDDVNCGMKSQTCFFPHTINL